VHHRGAKVHLGCTFQTNVIDPITFTLFRKFACLAPLLGSLLSFGGGSITPINQSSNHAINRRNKENSSMKGRFLPFRMASVILGFLIVVSSDAKLGGPTDNAPLDNTKDSRRLDSSSSNGDSSSSTQISAYQQWINSYKYGYQQQQQQQGSSQYQDNANGYSKYSYSNNYNYNNANANTDDVADDQVNNQAAGNGYNYNDDGANANDDGANTYSNGDDNADDGANKYNNGDDNTGDSSSNSNSNSGMDVQSDSGGTTGENGGWMGYIPAEWLNDERKMETFKMATGLLASVIAMMSIYICYLQCALRKPKDPVMKHSLLVAPDSPYRLDVDQIRQEAKIRETGEVMGNPNHLHQPSLS
jgi:hypothetical protein